MIQPTDLMSGPEVAVYWNEPLHTILRRVAAGDQRYPKPLRRVGDGARAPFVWRRSDVVALRPVTWTAEDGTTETGPFAVMKAKAEARGVIVRGDSVETLAAVPDEPLPIPTYRDSLPLKNGVVLQDVDYRATRLDQLPGEVQDQLVKWRDENGREEVGRLGDFVAERGAQ